MAAKTQSFGKTEIELQQSSQSSKCIQKFMSNLLNYDLEVMQYFVCCAC